MKKILFFASMLVLTSLANATNGFYIGGSLGYLTDSEVAYETGRIGYTFLEQGNTSHSVEFEVGHSYDEGNWYTVRVVPTVLNYRGETAISENAFIYYGIGGGSAYVKVEVPGYSASDSSFVFQSFAGAGFRVSESVSFMGGVRYLKVSDLDEVSSESDFGINFGIQISL